MKARGCKTSSGFQGHAKSKLPPSRYLTFRGRLDVGGAYYGFGAKVWLVHTRQSAGRGFEVHRRLNVTEKSLSCGINPWQKYVNAIVKNLAGS